jgi:hypothetical protein
VEALAGHSQGVDEMSLLDSVLPAAAKAPLLKAPVAAFYRFKSAASKPPPCDGVPHEDHFRRPTGQEHGRAIPSATSGWHDG